VGTAGQRCTTLRRLYVHEKVYDNFVPQLVKAYGSVAIGNPLLPGTLMGPLHNSMAVKVFVDTVAAAKAQGGKVHPFHASRACDLRSWLIYFPAQVLYGGATREQGANLPSKGHFVQPTIIEIDHSAAVVQHEAFVPCLYVMKIKSYEEAVAKNNAVSQGLSSSLFTRDMRNVFRWMGPQGSDCGLVNVNAGTSGNLAMFYSLPPQPPPA
jgi:aldehyde dehydrogenase family 7 protein A1